MSLTKEFSLEPGLRQSDPLYHFLFILTMDELHIMIEDDVANNYFRGVHVDYMDFYLSHLLYTNDVVDGFYTK